MQLKVLDPAFSVCQTVTPDGIDRMGEYVFVGKTDEEISLVCPTACVPDSTIAREDGWRAFRIQGVLDFSLIGILARITELLARERIGVFVVSTYNTEYVFIKEQNFACALQTLQNAGYEIV